MTKETSLNKNKMIKEGVGEHLEEKNNKNSKNYEIQGIIWTTRDSNTLSGTGW
jgi:hypothetical protein